MNNTTKDTFRIVVIARMKHGVLYEAIKKRGWTQKQAAEFLGISQQGLCMAMNLKGLLPHLFPKKLTAKAKKRARQVAEKLMELTGVPVQDLFPEAFRTKAFLAMPKVVERYADVPTRLLLEQTGMLAIPALPDEELIAQEERDEVARVLTELSLAQRHAIQRVVFDGASLKEAALERGVGRQSIHANLKAGVRAARHKIDTRRMLEELGTPLRHSTFQAAQAK